MRAALKERELAHMNNLDIRGFGDVENVQMLPRGTGRVEGKTLTLALLTRACICRNAELSESEHAPYPSPLGTKLYPYWSPRRERG